MSRHYQLEELYLEGFLDRQQARLSGVGGAIKGLGNTIAGGAKGAWAGLNSDVAGVEAAQQQRAQGGVKAGYNKGKIASITQTFQKDLASLFGPKWAEQFPNLQKELGAVQQAQPAQAPAAPTQAAQGQIQTQQPAQQTNPPAQSATPPPIPNQQETPTQPAVDKSKPLAVGQTVTGTGQGLGKGKFQVVAQNGDQVTVQQVGKNGKPFGQSSVQSRKTAIVEKKSNKFAETYQALREVVKL